MGDAVPFAIMRTITANGNSGITTGTLDISDPGNTGMNLGQTVNGTHGITSDGRGAGTIKTPTGSLGIDFVLMSSSHGLITRFDGNGTGSGTLDRIGAEMKGDSRSVMPVWGALTDWNANVCSSFGVSGAGSRDNRARFPAILRWEVVS